MSNKETDIDTKKHTYYHFNDIINITNFYSNNIKKKENSYKNILVYYSRYITIKDSKYVENISVNHLYIIFNKVN